MSGIRALTRDDLPQVAELYERGMRSGRRDPPPGLAPYFERTLLDHPWVDAEIPSLVYETEQGRMIGFLGSHVRRLSLDGRPLRLGCAGQLVSDPELRRLAVGAKLLRSYLSGAQDLTITDGATEVVREMWLRLGGHQLLPGSIVWTRLLRPARAVGERWLRQRRRPRLRRAGGPVLTAVDAAVGRVARPAQSDPAIEVAELTAEALVELQAEAFPAARLRVAYDRAYLEWLFAEMGDVRSRGRLVRCLLRRNGQALGWYIAYLRERGPSQVIEIAGQPLMLGTVLDHLFEHAWECGSSMLEGRLDPVLYEPLFHRRCLLRHGTRALYHARDPEVVAAMALGSALTRLDGEWWMGHHTERFETSPAT